MNVPDPSSNTLLVNAPPGTHWLFVLVLNLQSGKSHQSVFGPYTSKDASDRQGERIVSLNTSMTVGNKFQLVYRTISIN